MVFDCINAGAGDIVHRIVPEGESLDPCCVLLEKAHARDASYMLGYMPDCDGDRGNLVVWDSSLQKARALEAQEVFALACVAELAHLVWTGELVYDDNGKALTKAAVAVNDPTSMRIDRIAETFGIPVFRAEVGEANVVGLARRLRQEGYIVRIVGEGSAGGNITYPSAVRDPLSTVMAIVKLLSIRSSSSAHSPGLFEIWCKMSGQEEKYRDDFTLAQIIASLPYFITTSAYSDDAILRINEKDHALLKDRYQKVFLREWEEKKEELKTKYGFYNWEAIAYNGLDEKRGVKRFGEAGKGGLKICFLNEKSREAAYIWMRGSATEPVFRIMADVDTQIVCGSGEQAERDLLEWHRQMIMEADSR
jgi:phosphoglucomutase